MPETAPNPRFLFAACATVIRQNNELEFNPVRFMQATLKGGAVNLIEVCNGLILSPRTLEALESALAIYPRLLTLEDLVVHSKYSRDWGLSENAIRMAEARVKHFDQIVGKQRWAGQDENE